MNPNQALIDYQNELLQKNIDAISLLRFQIGSVRDAIASAQNNIETLDSQLTDLNTQIDKITAGNVLINETIVILTNNT